MVQIRAGPGTRLYKYDFVYNTANIATGVAVYTPAAGDVLLDAWILVTTAFNAAFKADIGTFDGETVGVFGDPLGSALDLTGAANTFDHISFPKTITEFYPFNLVARMVAVSSSAENGYNPAGTFLTTDPLKIVGNQTGAVGGAATGATVGAATLYFIIATPITAPG